MTSPHTDRRVVVVGAGLVGSMLAALLGREGYRVTVIERRGDPRRSEMAAGRSINLAISERGLNALAKLDLAQDILALGVPLYGRMIHPVTGPLAYQPYGVERQAINSFSRGELNLALVKAAGAAPNVTLEFSRRCLDVDLEAGTVSHVDAATGGDPRTTSGIIIGTDGAYSAVRAAMQRREQQDYSQSYLPQGYKELWIPAAPGGSPALERNAMHIWPRGPFMMMAMANLDATFTLTLYLPMTGPNSFAELDTPDRVRSFFERNFPDAIPIMPSLLEDFATNPASSLVTVRTYPWAIADRVLLAGDAAHAIVPFYGQGANAGFEDCLELLAQVASTPHDLAGAFDRYQRARKPNTDAIADLALANFVEMRDHVASKGFLLKKQFEQLLHKLFPRYFVPLYSMISFSLIPYATARARAQAQARTLRRIGVGLVILALGIVGWSLFFPG
ncbi:MAG: FAD-dependent monooxygenase [Gemmatimonadetes bacterium]|nr:FAD-dependent monooxygenase [Gemmatimonadota bacterium]